MRASASVVPNLAEPAAESAHPGRGPWSEPEPESEPESEAEPESESELESGSEPAAESAPPLPRYLSFASSSWILALWSSCFTRSSALR